MLVDYLLSNNFSLESPETLEIVNRYFKVALKVICVYLKKIPSLLSSMEEAGKEPALYMIDENIALSQCYHEMMFTLSNLLGINFRSLRYFLKYD